MPSKFTLHMIAAVAKKTYAIGYQNNLPWKRNHNDLRMFKAVTMNSYVLVGGRTSKTLPNLPGREIIEWNNVVTPEHMLAGLLDQDIYSAWLIGGAFTYEAFAPFVNGNVVINWIDFEGPYDTVFPVKAYGIA